MLMYSDRFGADRSFKYQFRQYADVMIPSSSFSLLSEPRFRLKFDRKKPQG